MRTNTCRCMMSGLLLNIFNLTHLKVVLRNYCYQEQLLGHHGLIYVFFFFDVKA